MNDGGFNVNGGTSIEIGEELKDLRTDIRFEAEYLKQAMVPQLKEVIRRFERDEISYEEARKQVDDLRKELGQ